MGPRTRRFIAAIATVLFLAAYVWGVVAIGDRLPESMWIDLLFYGVAGLAWGAPLIPLLSWAEGGRKNQVAQLQRGRPEAAPPADRLH